MTKDFNMKDFYKMPINSVGMGDGYNRYFSEPFLIFTKDYNCYESLFRTGKVKISVEEDNYLGKTFNDFYKDYVDSDFEVGTYDELKNGEVYFKRIPFEDIRKVALLESFSTNINANKSQPQREIYDYLTRASFYVHIDEELFWELILDTARHKLDIYKETGSFE
jgi:hypothetical protein